MATLVSSVGLLAVLVLAAALLPVPYVVLGPGPTVDTLGDVDGQDVITIKGKEPADREGHLNLTTVGVVDDISLFEALSGWLDSDITVVPREQVYPPDKSEEEQDQQNRAEFVQSQDAAIEVALRELKFPQKSVVVSVPKDSPSRGLLKPGDAIETINGQPVDTADAAPDILTGLEPGATVDVGYTRLGQPGTATITTTKADGRDGAALGITLSWQRKAPFDVSISVAEIGGPSAGLMLALGVIDLVGPTDLTDGKFIAGTGTIDSDGKVGPIGGIRLKMIAAKAAGAEAFLVPAGNCAEALDEPPEGLTLAKVDTLDSALAALADIRAGHTPASC